MNIGMLWFDNDPKRSLAMRLTSAMEFYQEKHKKTANLCFVHPSHLPTGQQTIAGVSVRPSKFVLPNHLWLGVDDTAGAYDAGSEAR